VWQMIYRESTDGLYGGIGKVFLFADTFICLLNCCLILS